MSLLTKKRIIDGMRVLDLFSGIGGFHIGLSKASMQTVAFCEIDPYCQSVLRKNFPSIPIHSDIRSIRQELHDDTVDVVCGGFPCQPFSVAGRQKGKDDNRHLWPEMLECIKHYRPTWVIGENVTGIISLALDDVLTDLEDEGYTTRAFVVPACAVGAFHRRNLVWILGHSEHNGQLAAKRRRGKQEDVLDHQTRTHSAIQSEGASDTSNVANPFGTGLERLAGHEEGKSQRAESFRCDTAPHSIEWVLCPDGKARPIEPSIFTLADGIPNRAAKLKAIGNAIYPEIAYVIGKHILEVESLYAVE